MLQNFRDLITFWQSIGWQLPFVFQCFTSCIRSRLEIFALLLVFNALRLPERTRKNLGDFRWRLSGTVHCRPLSLFSYYDKLLWWRRCLWNPLPKKLLWCGDKWSRSLVYVNHVLRSQRQLTNPNVKTKTKLHRHRPQIASTHPSAIGEFRRTKGLQLHFRHCGDKWFPSMDTCRCSRLFHCL